MSEIMRRVLYLEGRNVVLENRLLTAKALILKLVEACEGAEKTFILIHKLRNFRDEKDLRADECREEIKTLASTLSTVITEANEVMK